MSEWNKVDKAEARRIQDTEGIQDRKGSREVMEEKGTQALIEELLEKLDWYTFQATEEEYDEKAVESILYLLDTLQPVDEEEMPDVDEMWKQFMEMTGSEEEDEATEVFRNEKSDMTVETIRPLEQNEAVGRTAKPKVIYFWEKHRGIVAAILVILVMAVVGTVQSEAVSDSGFFHWLKRDETGKQMVTSPEGLDGKTQVNVATEYYEKDEMPQWTKEWVEIMENRGMEKSRLKCYRIKSASHYKSVWGIYKREEDIKELVMGMMFFQDKQTFNTEIFGDYAYVNSIILGERQIEIYKKVEESGETYYRGCYWKGNTLYYVQAATELDAIYELLEEYLVLFDSN